MTQRLFGRMTLPVIAALLFGAAMTAQAGHVEAIANTASDIQDGPTAVTASAADAGFTANTTRFQGITTANISGQFFTAPSQPVRARAWSEFAVEGLNTLTPLTFVWQFTGSRSWNPDNAAVSIGMGVGLQSAGFIDNVGWGISYVDAPPSFGDFAGVLSSPFGVSAAGVGFSNVLPVGDWNGLGSRQVSSTMQWALTDTTGSFSLDVNGGMVGDVLGSNTLTLIGLTVPVGTVLANSGAFLLLDNGVRLRITAVPEPQAWALLAVGLALVGFRRRAMGAPQG